jgi:hypothetical protein
MESKSPCRIDKCCHRRAAAPTLLQESPDLDAVYGARSWILLRHLGPGSLPGPVPGTAVGVRVAARSTHWTIQRAGWPKPSWSVLDGHPDILAAQFDRLGSALAVAVPPYAGLSVTMNRRCARRHDTPDENLTVRGRASLRIPLRHLTPASKGPITFSPVPPELWLTSPPTWISPSGTPAMSWWTRTPGGLHRDQDTVRASTSSGTQGMRSRAEGVRELGRLDQTGGVMIDQRYEPAEALAERRRRAEASGTDLHAVVENVLHRWHRTMPP